MRIVNKYLRRHRLVVEAQKWEQWWDNLLWDTPAKPAWRRYVWFHNVKDNTPWWDDEDRVYIHSDWWKIKHQSDEYGRKTVDFPVGWRRNVVVAYGAQCWCNEFFGEDFNDVDTYDVGCPVLNSTLKWIDERKATPFYSMVDELMYDDRTVT